jgi:hypothetical protein
MNKRNPYKVEWKIKRSEEDLKPKRAINNSIST